ncbi:hypothetical protein CV_1307 [Chromobacterium violaceum ATCC 12472]|uniref:Uncharacterized protein n=1 Tax=Chromobacterium violaceum (strain ATCC 12472 / DSM 30191 / JCM 1249 / CCUG 213 / NBRC 12614 / NCIMB 9131 / NCTC 9757 / MK) TaxID=243365 RepID=Q7NYG7_CHRVO|nr:hypothetical protein CV_1307 [Chromobacterium violaceum ATCC 12472]
MFCQLPPRDGAFPVHLRPSISQDNYTQYQSLAARTCPTACGLTPNLRAMTETPAPAASSSYISRCCAARREAGRPGALPSARVRSTPDCVRSSSKSRHGKHSWSSSPLCREGQRHQVRGTARAILAGLGHRPIGA